MNKWAAFQHKWQREWAGGQSPPLTIKREKQSKEAIDINKVLTTIDLLAIRWWAMIVMDLNSHTQLINIYTFLLKQPIRPVFVCRRANADHPTAPRQRCVCCDILAECNGNCSSAQHPAGSSLTVRQTVTSISCIWARAKSASFSSSAHTARTKGKYTV